MNNKLIIICLILGATLLISCSKMNDLHQPYLDEGEFVYAPKITSVTANPGKNRIQLNLVIASQRVSFVRIFWNDRKDSSEIKIDGKTGVFPKLIENMTEKSYVFQYVSFDIYGNKSLPYESIEKVYGANYELTLVSRNVKTKSKAADGTVSISWSAASVGEIRTEVKYKNPDGEWVDYVVQTSETSLVLKNYGSDLSYWSIYKPTENSLDEFKSVIKPITF